MRKIKSKAIAAILLMCVLCQGVTGCDNTEGNKIVENNQEVKETKASSDAAETTDDKKSKDDIITFSGKDIEGNDIVSATVFAENKITMVNVWATFCQPCIQELPDLEELNNSWKDKGIQIVGIVSDVADSEGNYDKTYWDLGKSILKENGVTYKNIICDISTFWDKVNLDAVPTTFFVDKNGKLVGKVQVGSVSKEEYTVLAEEALGMVQ